MFSFGLGTRTWQPVKVNFAELTKMHFSFVSSWNFRCFGHSYPACPNIDTYRVMKRAVKGYDHSLLAERISRGKTKMSSRTYVTSQSVV